MVFGTSDAAPPSLPSFTWVANGSLPELDNHRAFGHAFGARFSHTIAKRFAAKESLSIIIKAAHTPAGRELYGRFLTLHRNEFPSAMAELDGLAEGSGVAFEDIFLQNINEEFSLCAADLPGSKVNHTLVESDACSDVMACDPDPHAAYCAVAHNEDNQAEDRGTVVMVDARFGARKPAWFAATYAGGLPSGAFGFSKTGRFGFTLNYVGPKAPMCPGVGRAFVSRALLSADSYDAGLALITRASMGSGHNYQLFDFAEEAPRVTNVEVAPRGLYAIRPIGAAPFFHANQVRAPPTQVPPCLPDPVALAHLRPSLTRGVPLPTRSTRRSSCRSGLATRRCIACAAMPSSLRRAPPLRCSIFSVTSMTSRIRSTTTTRRMRTATAPTGPCARRSLISTPRRSPSIRATRGCETSRTTGHSRSECL